MTPDEVRMAEHRYLVPTYARPDVVFTHGSGVHLYDAEGRAYLDFGAGIAVNALGFSDPEWCQAVSDQATKLVHVSNLYHSSPHVQLAQRLVEHSFADRVFFGNSGSEANEAAIKFARAWARRGGRAGTDIVAFEGGFHGRTLGSLSITPRQKYQAPFEPLVPGVHILPFNDLEAARRAIDERVCAVFVEPIQGEGGVRPADKDFLLGLRSLCAETGALLVFDEIQCGLGRAGTLWAHEFYEVEPDMMTLAKPLAGGLPIGATLVTEEVARVIHVGDHGSTFGAGPLVCRSAQVVFDRISRPAFLENVVAQADNLWRGLQGLESKHLLEIRGRGLMIGLEFDVPVGPLVDSLLQAGLIGLTAGENVLRMTPPLVIEKEHVDQAIDILNSALSGLEGPARDA